MDLAPPSDAEALRRSLSDPRSFVAIFERHHAVVRRYLARRVGDGLADELAGETFARAFKQRSRYQATRDTALPWLFGIAGRVIHEHRRAEKRRLRSLERLCAQRDELSDGGVGGEVELLPPDVVRALRRLAPRERDTLLLVAWGELTYEEVAVALGVPVGTVRSRISRARQRLEGSFPAPLMTTVPGDAHA